MFVYGVICHKLTNPLNYTVWRLAESKQNHIIIHVDKKTSINQFEKITKLFSNFSNVEILLERIDVRWGAFSQIEVMLKLLEKSLKYNYKYFSFISGDDIPLKSNEYINNFLNKSYEKGIEYIGAEFEGKNYENRLNIKHPEIMFDKNRSFFVKIITRILNSYNRIFKKIDMSNFPKIYKGTCWFTITKDAVEYILRYIEENDNYKNFFIYSFCGDELFFHTILYNSIFQEKIHKLDDRTDCENSLRYIDWISGPEFPKVLVKSDLNEMSDEFLLFARKIKEDMDFDDMRYFEDIL